MNNEMSGSAADDTSSAGQTSRGMAHSVHNNNSGMNPSQTPPMDMASMQVALERLTETVANLQHTVWCQDNKIRKQNDEIQSLREEVRYVCSFMQHQHDDVVR